MLLLSIVINFKKNQLKIVVILERGGIFAPANGNSVGLVHFFRGFSKGIKKLFFFLSE